MEAIQFYTIAKIYQTIFLKGGDFILYNSYFNKFGENKYLIYLNQKN